MCPTIQIAGKKFIRTLQSLTVRFFRTFMTDKRLLNINVTLPVRYDIRWLTIAVFYRLRKAERSCRK